MNKDDLEWDSSQMSVIGEGLENVERMYNINGILLIKLFQKYVQRIRYDVNECVKLYNVTKFMRIHINENIKELQDLEAKEIMFLIETGIEHINSVCKIIPAVLKEQSALKEGEL